MPDPSLFRSKTIGVRVTEDDYARFQVLADAQGKTVGEWCRDVLSEIAQNPGGKPKPIDHDNVMNLAGRIRCRAVAMVDHCRSEYLAYLRGENRVLHKQPGERRLRLNDDALSTYRARDVRS